MTTTAAAPVLSAKPKAVDLTSPDLIQPAADRILVLPAPAEVKKGAIHIPDQGRERPYRGIAVRVGQGAQCPGGCGALVPMEVRQGDTVLYGKYAGTDIQIDNTTYVLMREAEVIGIVRAQVAPELPAAPAVN